MHRSALITATSLALGTAVISGVTNFLSKISVTVVKDAIVFTTLKNAVVALLLVGIILGAKKWSEIKTLNKRHWLKLIAIGLIGGSVPFALYFTGLTHTSALNASLIHKTMFLWVSLLAIPLLKERMTKWQWVGIGAVAIANLFIGGFQGFKFNTGELMILAATMLWAVENIIAKLALKDISSLTVAGARMVFGSVALIAFLAVRGGAPAVTHLSSAQWGWTLLVSALLFGYVITWYTALKRAPATYVATLLVPATLVTNALTAIFITHTFPLVQIGSALFVTLGAFLMIKFAKPVTVLASNNILPVQTPAEGGR
jgi:drug/metabolite transporter (DMT)-like permease